jgi:hypothetical protein
MDWFEKVQAALERGGSSWTFAIKPDELKVQVAKAMIAKHPVSHEWDWREPYRWIGLLTDGRDLRMHVDLYNLCVRGAIFHLGERELNFAQGLESTIQDEFMRRLNDSDPDMPPSKQRMLLRVFQEIILPAQAGQSLRHQSPSPALHPEQRRRTGGSA